VTGRDPELCQVVQHAPGHPEANTNGDPYRSAEQAEQAPGQQTDGRPDRTLVARLFDRHLSVGVSGNNGLCVEVDAAFILQLLESLGALIRFTFTIEYNYNYLVHDFYPF
jgi:hypothetical protein